MHCAWIYLWRSIVIAFLCLQEDLGEHVVQGDAHPGHVGTACLLSSSFLENGKDNGVATLPIMGRNSRQTIGKVRGKPPTLADNDINYLKKSFIVYQFKQCYSCFSGLPGDPAHPRAAVWHELLLRQVLEEKKCSWCWSQGSWHLARSQVSHKYSRNGEDCCICSPLTKFLFWLALYRHHRIRENTIASFKSAANHVSFTGD